MNDDANEIVDNCRLSNNKTTTYKSFEHKTKITGGIAASSSVLNTKVAVPLKYLNNFWRSLDLPLINYEIELDLTWSEDCVISEILNYPEVPADSSADPPIAHISEGSTTDAIFEINSTNFMSQWSLCL